MSNLCNQCGFENPANNRFCGNCGARFDSSEPEKVQFQNGVSALGVMVGGDLKERFHQAGLQATGQHRNVTILFADLSDYTHLSEKIDPEDLYLIVQRFINMLALTVYEYEGTVDKFTGDGLMALFGAPIAHENNAERAIRAAMDMQAGLVQLNKDLKSEYDLELQVHIGLNSGSVIVGSVGSADMMMDYTAIGETVNMAQRLESAADSGEILVSESVYRQTRRIFDFHLLPHLSLKGVSNPVPGYRLLGLKRLMGSVRGLDELQSPMIGRETELNQLTQAVRLMLRSDTGCFALIKGDAGIGKSRLVYELKAKIIDRQVKIIQGRSLTYRKSVAYWVFQDLLRDYLGATSETSDQQVQEMLSQKVEQTSGNQAAELLPYLEYILSLNPSDPDMAQRLAFLGADQLRQQVFVAVRNWLAAEAQQCPLIIILDDLHWADDASLELLRFILEIVPSTPLMICGVTRPRDHELLQKLEDWANNRLNNRFININLKSLPPALSEQLFNQLVMIPDLPQTVRDEIIKRAAGVPFYLEEILRMLIDDEIISFRDGVWRLRPGADIASLGVPDNLQSLILTRFDRLQPEYRRVLQVASVIGRVFSLPVLSSVLELDESTVQQSLHYLEERAFVDEHSDRDISEFTFRHVLTSDAIYSTLMRRERRDLHGRIGIAIENTYPDRLNEHTYILAKHYSWSSVLDKALHYGIIAGKKALRDYLVTQAKEYFISALENLEKVEHKKSQAMEVQIGLGDVFVFVGEYENARGHYHAAEELIDIGDPDQFGKYIALRRKISTTLERQGDFEGALEHLEAAQKIVNEADIDLPFEKAKNLSEIGWINFRRGALDIAEKYLLEALDLDGIFSQYDVVASIYNRLGGVFFQKDDLDQASYYVRKSLLLREEIGDIGGVARSYNNLGLLAWKRGDWNDALGDFARSIELNQDLGDVEAMVFLHNNIGLLQTDKGNLDLARKHLDESLARSQQIGHIALEGEVYLHFSRYWLAAQEWEKSLFYSNQAMEIFQEIGSQERLVDLYASIGEAWLGLRDGNKALQAGTKAQNILKENFDPTVPSVGNARILRLMGNVSRLQNSYDQAGEFLNKSIEQFRVLKNMFELGRTYCDLAILERALGNSAKARIHAKEARLMFHRLGATLDLEKIDEFLLTVSPKTLPVRTRPKGTW